MDNSYQNPNQGGYYQPPPPPPPQNYYQQQPQYPQPSSSNAVMALVFGILSWILCGILTGIPAWIIGNIELKKISQGISPESNRGMATAGMWLGIVNTIIFALGIIVFIILLAIGTFASTRYRY